MRDYDGVTRAARGASAAAAMSDSGASEEQTSVDEGMVSPGLAAALEVASQGGWLDDRFPK